MKPAVLTQYSSHANTIADTFRAAFAKTKVGDHTVEMTAPEGSTGGGLLALQHITLKPESGMALVVGTVNAGEKRVELRSYAHVAKVSMDRFKRPLTFDEPSYGAYVDKATTILSAFGLDVVVSDAGSAPTLDEEEAPLASSPPPKRSWLPIALFVIAVGLAIGGGGAWWLLR
ncbi:MAG: hypothetical protein KF819_31475 [Labilithrix sp.]|nr:hypothetical protein [Labilithrix sp.]